MRKDCGRVGHCYKWMLTVLIAGWITTSTACAQAQQSGVKFSTSPAARPAAVNEQVVYGGQAPDDAGITLSAWGGGSASVSTDEIYLKAGHSLQVVTLGPYEGGQVTFTKPLDLGNLAEQQHRFLQFIIQLSPAPGYEEFGNPPSTSPNPATPANPAPTTPPDSGSGALPLDPHSKNSFLHLAQYPSRPAQRPTAPAGGSSTPAPAASSVEENQTLPLTSLHLTFQLAGGAMADIMRPIPQADTTWLRVAVPLSALPFAAGGTDAQLQRIVVAGNGPATVTIGEIRLIDDDTPITADPLDEMDVATGDEVNFHGNGDGGASSLKYSWDFDTKGSFVDEADGQTVTHHYTQSGDYKVTLLVSDLDGIKKPVTVTTVAHVED